MLTKEVTASIIPQEQIRCPHCHRIVPKTMFDPIANVCYLCKEEKEPNHEHSNP